MSKIIGVASLLLLASVTPGLADEPKISILSAKYAAANDGTKSCEFPRKFDCTADGGRTCSSLPVNNGLCGDPANGTPKKATVTYQCSWSAVPTSLTPFLRPVKQTVEVLESLSLPPLSCTGQNPPPRSTVVGQFPAGWLECWVGCRCDGPLARR